MPLNPMADNAAGPLSPRRAAWTYGLFAASFALAGAAWLVGCQEVPAADRRPLTAPKPNSAMSAATAPEASSPAPGTGAEDAVDWSALTEDDWKARLTPAQYRVLREEGTERAGTSPLNAVKAAGTFVCAGCGAALFDVDAKFESGTGWPSFYRPVDGVDGDAVAERKDTKFFMTRTEVHCDRCGGHLGHVFDDGPAPTGLRYCINGVSLDFEPAETANE